jgi:hypothetical protein
MRLELKKSKKESGGEKDAFFSSKGQRKFLFRPRRR